MIEDGEVAIQGKTGLITELALHDPELVGGGLGFGSKVAHGKPPTHQAANHLVKFCVRFGIGAHEELPLDLLKQIAVCGELLQGSSELSVHIA